MLSPAGKTEQALLLHGKKKQLNSTILCCNIDNDNHYHKIIVDPFNEYARG